MKKLELVVGAFMLAGILSLAWLAIQVSGLNPAEQARGSYRLYAEFNNASGLTERARVTIAGVLVGRVTDIRLDPETVRARVEMTIREDVDYITDDSIAAVKTAGVLGEKYISIAVGGSEEMLTDGGRIRDTQSSLVLEDLIGKFMTSFMEKKP